MKRFIASCLLIFALVPIAYADRLLGKHIHPYKDVGLPEVLSVLPSLFRADRDSTVAKWKNKQSLRGETEALMYEFRQYNLNAPAHYTSGWDDFVEAEWPFMGMVYTGLALCNLANTYPDLKEKALTDTQWILNAIQTPAISGFMASHFGEPFPSHGPIDKGSVFLHGHTLYLAVRYRETFQSQKFDDLSHRTASALSRGFLDQPIQASYADMWYLADNIVALAALRRYDAAFNTTLSRKPVRAFLREVRTYYMDEYPDLISTFVAPQWKQPDSPARGIGVMYGLVFLKEVNAAFAREQWRNAKHHLIRTLPDLLKANSQILPMADQFSHFGSDLYVSLEHVDRPGMTFIEKNMGDIDSGPIILGAGTSASGFALAAAKRMNDVAVADGLEDLAILMGNPTWIDDRLYYPNMFHPVGQAIILYGKTLITNP